MEGNSRFPEAFRFGTATASFQIEGSPLADGAAASNWYRFTRRRGAIEDGGNADVACDHYHRYHEDIEHMVRLGIDDYRFSISWPRVEPEPGRHNQAGIDFYDRLIDELLEAGIKPVATMFHWDEPAWFEDRGGFTDAESPGFAARYADTIVRRFSDRVRSWITINEPMVYAVQGYLLGVFPPGRKLDVRGFFRTSHHLLKAHAAMVETVRGVDSTVEVGLAEAQVHIVPYRPNLRRDRRAAALMDAVLNRMFIDPITRGTYPEEILPLGGRRLPAGWERDLDTMHPKLDFVGMNYYTGQAYRYSFFRRYAHAKEAHDPSAKRSAMWEIHPEGLYELLARLKEQYGNPRVLITENGYPLPETDGPLIEDTERIDYLHRHLNQVLRAVSEGVRCEGYYLWSLLDNFEWHLGYTMRFGIIRTDFPTGTRKWKRSAYWYRDLIEGRALPPVPPRPL